MPKAAVTMDAAVFIRQTRMSAPRNNLADKNVCPTNFRFQGSGQRQRAADEISRGTRNQSEVKHGQRDAAACLLPAGPRLVPLALGHLSPLFCVCNAVR